MQAELAARYNVQRHVPGTLNITVLDEDGSTVDLTNATEIRVNLLHEDEDWTSFSNFTSYSNIGAGARVQTGSASQGEVLFTYDSDVFASQGEYKMGVQVFTAQAPSGSLYPEFAWDTVTVWDQFPKSIQNLLNRFRTTLLMWSGRYETVFPSENSFKDFELYEFLYQGMQMFNQWPPNATSYTLDNFPTAIESPLFLCSLIHLLIGLEIREVGIHFNYNDNGLSFQRDKSGKYGAILGQIQGMLNGIMPNLKKQIGLDSLRIKGQFSGMVSMPRSLDRALRGTRYWR